MQREARWAWGATIPGTGASGATGDVGEMRGITAVPPWSRQAGGEADGGEEGAARGGAQRGESKGEAEMALGAAGRTPARAATPRGNTLRLGEPKGGGSRQGGGRVPGSPRMQRPTRGAQPQLACPSPSQTMSYQVTVESSLRVTSQPQRHALEKMINSLPRRHHVG